MLKQEEPTLNKIHQTIKYLFFLFVLSKKSVFKLSKENYLAQTISIFIIVYILWAVILVVCFKENIANATIHRILVGMISGPLSPLFLAVIFYGVNLLFKRGTSFKSIIQITICLGIIEGIFFSPLLLLLFIGLPFNEITMWIGKIIATLDIIWLFLILMYFGEVVVMHSKSKSIIISIITLILYMIITAVLTL